MKSYIVILQPIYTFALLNFLIVVGYTLLIIELHDIAKVEGEKIHSHKAPWTQTSPTL